ncbi:MAG TPA: hypothetical protein VHX38_18475 [Pseudonocardiaceae bacterium]|nr:hypothetical protein [Pseudonocardiaceae bacterium]
MDTSTGSATEITQLGYQVNAIGYASQQNLAYGIATRDGRHGFGDGGHLVSIGPQGALVDLGPVHGGFGRLSDAVAGAVIGSQLYLHADGLLYSVGIDPNGSGFRSVTRVVGLHPDWLADGIDDFDLDTANGLLYGVGTADGWHPALLSVDPSSGTVRQVRTLQGLPALASYGSVVLAGQVMYAVADEAGGRARLYRIPLDGSGSATEISDGPPASVTDMAGCLDTPTIPTTMPTAPAPTTPLPPPRPDPPKTPQALPSPAAAAPTPSMPAATTTTPAALVPPVPPTTAPPFPLPAARTVAQAAETEQTTQRRWALTTVVIIFGGGAVAARRASARARRG